MPVEAVVVEIASQFKLKNLYYKLLQAIFLMAFLIGFDGDWGNKKSHRMRWPFLLIILFIMVEQNYF